MRSIISANVNKVKKTKKCLSIISKIGLTLEIPQKGLRDPEGCAYFALRTTTLEV